MFFTFRLFCHTHTHTRQHTAICIHTKCEHELCARDKYIALPLYRTQTTERQTERAIAIFTMYSFDIQIQTKCTEAQNVNRTTDQMNIVYCEVNNRAQSEVANIRKRVEKQKKSEKNHWKPNGDCEQKKKELRHFLPVFFSLSRLVCHAYYLCSSVCMCANWISIDFVVFFSLAVF